MKLKVQAQSLQPGDVVGSGERIIGTMRGFQYDIKCNGVDASLRLAKPAITVFAEDRTDAIASAVKELQKYGYTNLTVDKIVSHR